MGTIYTRPDHTRPDRQTGFILPELSVAQVDAADGSSPTASTAWKTVWQLPWGAATSWVASLVEQGGALGGALAGGSAGTVVTESARAQLQCK